MINKNIKNVVIAFAATIFSLSLLLTPVQAAVQTNVRVPLQFFVFIPCANSGQGEEAIFSGTLHLVSAVTADNNGGFHVKLQENSEGGIATGQVSGDIWHGTGVSTGEFNIKAGSTVTIVETIRMIGSGSTPNWLAHVILHATVNADGKVTTEIEKINVTCR